MAAEYRHPIRVIFGDTDQMGFVYYGNYMRFFESSRAALLRFIGYSGKDLQRWGIGFPVAEAHARYLRPAFYEDELEVVVWISQHRTASLRFEYRIEREGEILATGYTRHACASAETGRPCRIPSELSDAIKAALAAAQPETA